MKKAEKLRDECQHRAFVALCNVRAAKSSTTKMRDPSPVVVGLLEQAQSALQEAIDEIDKAQKP